VDKQKKFYEAGVYFWLKYASIQVKMTIITKSATQTQKAGKLLAESLKGKALICLEGELGSGKTTFIQGLARGLGIKERITSPTFVILKRFKVSKIQHLYHIDCYRIKNPQELLDLGFGEILEEKNAVVVIEWADRIREILPKDRLIIKFEFIDEKTRKIIIK